MIYLLRKIYDCLFSVRNGAEGRNRTDTGLPPPDFESGASTNFTTPAKLKNMIILILAQFLLNFQTSLKKEVRKFIKRHI